MRRREFCKLVAAEGGLAASLPALFDLWLLGETPLICASPQWHARSESKVAVSRICGGGRKRRRFQE
jgi:hypothetical protein